jgi:glucose-1-phosphate cytidylyltransferase
MKVVLLAGGLGTRLAEETSARPKPMVEIGGYPMLWHIMMIYSQHGLNEFIVCLGYKGDMIKDYFANYVMHRSDFTVDMAQGSIEYHGRADVRPWKVTLVDTGPETMTGGRIRRVGHLLPKGESFCMTYGDGVSNVDITATIDHHKKSGLLATLTAIRPPGRFGVTVLEGDKVVQFAEKPAGDGSYINGGFFVLEPEVVDRVPGDTTVWEAEPLNSLVADGQLGVFRHEGFWQAMDTLREKQYLEGLWSSGKAPWKTW